MTKRANPKRDPLNLDQYLHNQGAAKTGLNRALLGRNLGRIKEFTQYKSRRAGLMFVEVEPAGTSTSAPSAIIRMPETGFHKPISVASGAGTGNTRTDSAGPMSRHEPFRRLRRYRPELLYKMLGKQSEKRSTRGVCMSRGIPQKPAVHGGSIIDSKGCCRTEVGVKNCDFATGEYLEIYFNPTAIRTRNIDEVEEPAVL